MEKLRIIFMGTPDFAVASLAALKENGHQIVGVVTVPDKPAGRGKKLQMSAVKKYALEHDLFLLTPLKLKDPEFLDTMASLKADVQVVVAFRMLPEVVWNMPKWGTFNLHASLLPQYRGAAPINHAIINGETVTGVTTFFLDHQIDTGKIIDQKRCQIEEEDTAGDLHDKLMVQGAQLVLETVDKLEKGEIEAQPQNSFLNQLELKHAPKIFKEDGLVDWNRPSDLVYNQIRGLSPYPAAWTWLQEKSGAKFSMKIYSAKKTSFPSKDQPGSIQVDAEGHLLVHCSDYCLEILELQLQGKKRMKTQDFLRGFSISIGMRFSRV